MVEALRLTLVGNIPHERVKIYSHFLDGHTPAPNIFEDSQLVFTCKEGKVVVPDYSVIIIHLHKKRLNAPDSAVRVKRILLSEDINYQDCYIINQSDYARYGVPQIFREYEQLTFIVKGEGLFITTDFQVQKIELWEKD
jgi:hypothetical protein